MKIRYIKYNVYIDFHCEDEDNAVEVKGLYNQMNSIKDC